MTYEFFFRTVYRLVSYSLLLPSLLWLLWRSHREPSYRRHLKERLGWVDIDPDHSGAIWIHAASVGEVMAVSPLIDALLTIGPHWNIAVSTNTPTGRSRAQALWGERILCFYAPLDTPGAIDRLVRRLQPTLLLTVEREIWPERFLRCQDWGIPTVVINGRLSARSASQYRRLRSFFRRIWGSVSLVTTPDPENAEAFRQLGLPAERVAVTGNLKFDIPPPTATNRGPFIPSPEATAAVPTTFIVLGSSHSEDEAAVLEGYKEFRGLRPDIYLVVAPRHPARFDTVVQSLASIGLRVYRTASKAIPDWSQVDVVVVDQMGKLIDWYRQAAIGIVGGTFGNAGGHSPLEPVQAGIPIFFGPSQHSAESLFHDIQRVGAGSEVAGGVPLWRAIEGLLSDRTRYEAAVLQGRSLISQKKGASQRTLQALENIWPTRLGNSAPAVVRRTQASGVVWLDPEIASMQEFRDAAAFSWLRNPFFARPLSAGGRGRAFFVDINGRRGLFRHYRRGGLLGRVIDDTYIGSQPDGSRAMREFSLLRWAKLSGLPVPRPLAANIEKHGLLRYKANLITEEIVDAEPLSTCLTRHPLGPDLWKRVGVLLTRLHSHQIYHADLNCHNLLIDRQETIWIIDFDKSYVLPGNTWKAKNLARLYRSLKKEASRSEHFYFCDDDWVVLFLAYHARPNTL